MNKIRFYDNAKRPPKKELYNHYAKAKVTLAWLSDHYNVTERIIILWLRDYKITKKRLYTRLEDRAIDQLRTAGFSYDEIAKVLDTFKATVIRRHKSYLEWLEQDNGE